MKIPFLTTNQIELEAYKLLSEFSARFGPITKPPIDVDGIIESLLELDCRFDDLRSSLGEDVLGATWIDDRKVRIDESLDPSLNSKIEGRYRFTLAHETGHWRLHRPLIEAKSRQHSLFAEEVAPSIVCRSSARDPMEWQADSFAGYLLMPESLVRQEWSKCNANIAPNLVFEAVENPLVPISLADSNAHTSSVVRAMAKTFRVSGQAMQIRLTGLGLIQTETGNAMLFY